MEMAPRSESAAEIKVVGVGGGGCNAVNRMIEEDIQGVSYVAVNTDAQALVRSQAALRVRIGNDITRGRGTGGDPTRGSESAEASREELANALGRPDMVFITAGMGGGTGTGAAPVLAELAREAGALTVAIVTKPFTFEGTKRRAVAEEGIQRLQDMVDTIIVVPNDRLLDICEPGTSIRQAFRTADDVLRQGIQGISQLITEVGDINPDFADVRSIMENAGSAMMAIGRARGQDAAVEAARQAISSPLLDTTIEGATKVLINLTCGEELSIHEMQQAAEVVAKAADRGAEVIFGLAIRPQLEDEVQMTVIATGFGPRPGALLGYSAQAARLFDPGEVEGDDLDLPPFLRRSLATRSNGTRLGSSS